LLALGGDDPHIVVISEFKLTFNLELILQGVDRAAACDEVWLAARCSSREKGRASDARFGTFAEGSVSACSECGRMVRWTCWCVPLRRCRKNPGRRSRLVEEHRRRRGDPVEGGGSRTPIMTTCRQRALACVAALAQGPRRPRDGHSRRSLDLARQRLWVVRPRRARGLHLGRVWPSRAPSLAAAGTATAV
jgi:hypothetical protein